MSDTIKSILEGKSILLLGFGSEGQASYELLRTFFPNTKLYVADRDDQLLDKNPQLKEDQNIDLIIGEDYLEKCGNYDLIIKSPGIPYELVCNFFDPSIITSQTDLFLRAYSERVIGVTGTKGKSTTTTLIYHLLKEAGKKVILSGNIGIPPLSLCADLDNESIIVFEMSSHQLEHITIAPRTAVILNIFPEHLDYYKDFTAYKMAKFNISLMQTEDDLLIYNADDLILRELLDEHSAVKKTKAYSVESELSKGAYLYEDSFVINIDGQHTMIPLDKTIDLPGKHNLSNALAAILVGMENGLTVDDIRQGFETYKRPAHRLEYIGTYDGVVFYNDSIATIPEACIEALKTLEKVDLLILGGFDRGLDYEKLYAWLKTHPVPNLIFIGDAGLRMKKEVGESLGGMSDCFFAEDMDAAFYIIKENIKIGNVCLLSPAAASYGMFRNFEERGELFKKMAAEFLRLPSTSIDE